MPNTYSQIYIHSVFAVKYFKSQISNNFKTDLMAVMGTHLNETGCETLIINGVEDHVHCLYRLMPKLAISDVIQKVKAKSSGWLNSSKLLENRFEWQSGFGAFSISYRDVDVVYKYILNQEHHHKNIIFLEEYMQLLKDHNVDFNSEYIFRDMI